jgi:hypothetical protein
MQTLQKVLKFLAGKRKKILTICAAIHGTGRVKTHRVTMAN